MKTKKLYTGFTISLISFYASAAVYQIGPSRTYKLPSQVSTKVVSGDTVYIDAGSYIDSAKWTANNLFIKGIGGFAHVRDKVYGQKGIWVIAGDKITIENIEFSGGKIGDNGAGIRAEGGDLYIRNCYFHDNENGILCSSENPTKEISIENSEFHDNGNLDLQHNMYIGRWKKFTLKHCYSHNVKGNGQLVKTRALENHILYNRITDENTNSLYPLVIQNGGIAYVIGNLIQNRSGGDDKGIIDYASGSYDTSRLNPNHKLYMINNTIINDHTNFTHGVIDMRDGHLIEAKLINNLIVGVSSNKLVWYFPNQGIDTVDNSSKIIASNNIFTSTPGLINQTGYDYHLTAISPAINAGINPGTGNGIQLTPTIQYVHPLAAEPRPVAGTLDVGAYEYEVTASMHVDRQVVRSLNIYPNPMATDANAIQIKINESGIFNLQVFNVTGQQVWEERKIYVNENADILIEVKDLNNGIYLLLLTNDLNAYRGTLLKNK